MHRAKASSSSPRLSLPITSDTTPRDLCTFAKSIPKNSALLAKKKGAGTFLYARPVSTGSKARVQSPQALQKESVKCHLAAEVVGYVLRRINARDDTVIIDGAKVPKVKAILLDRVAGGAEQDRVDGLTELLDALVNQDAGPYGKELGKVERGYLRFQKAKGIEAQFDSGRELMVQYLLNSDIDPWVIESLETILSSEGDNIDWRSAIADSSDFIAGHIETLEKSESVLPIPSFFEIFCERWAAARQEQLPLCAQLPFALLLDDVAAMVARRVKNED
ncbi:MAG: hypothetical protein JWR21_1061 [Herminiimonas sp.]|nr:hypothetical protein [Herminiimonas sp.]